MGEDVVGDEHPAGLDLLPGEPEQPLVVVLLRVDEDDVEHVLDLRQQLERVGLEELGPLLKARPPRCSAPGLRLRGSCYEREDAATE